VNADMCYDLLTIPPEIKQKIATFLCPHDAVQVGLTCVALRQSLSLSSLDPPLLLFARMDRVGDFEHGDYPVRAFRFPILNRRVHSLSLGLRWRDQGWGNRKGQVFVTAISASTVSQRRDAFEDGRIVFESDIAPHEQSALRINFVPIDSDIYYFWYKAGGGGGHSLHLSDGNLRTVIFDDEHQTIAHSYRNLTRIGVINPALLFENAPPAQTQTFFPCLLVRIFQLLRHQLEQKRTPDEELVTYLQEHEIAVNQRSLSALEGLVQADIEEREIRRHEGMDQVRNHAHIPTIFGLGRILLANPEFLVANAQNPDVLQAANQIDEGEH
jgi:hypothetical protein